MKFEITRVELASVAQLNVGLTGNQRVVGRSKGVVYPASLGVQLILAYSWARPAILAAGKGRGGMFLFLLFLHFHSFSSLFPVPLFHFLLSLLTLFSLSLGDNTVTHKGWRVVKPQHNQSVSWTPLGWQSVDIFLFLLENLCYEALLQASLCRVLLSIFRRPSVCCPSLISFSDFRHLLQKCKSDWAETL